MTTSFDLLPTELLDDIVQDLPIEDLASLWKNSHRFHHYLFGSPSLVDSTFLWACKNGDVELIRGAVTQGADPSFAKAPKQEHASGQYEYLRDVGWMQNWLRRRDALDAETGPFKVSTLGIVSRKGHLEAFKVLLDLGAALDDLPWSQHKVLVRNLQKVRGWPTWMHLMDSGLSSKLKCDQSGKLTLVAFIQRGAPVALIRKMLDSGADPNRIVRSGLIDLASPLSAAVVVQSTEIFDLLIERGADAHGLRDLGKISEDWLRVRRGKNIPILAAANVMAKTGRTKFVDRCLQAGVNINFSFPSILSSTEFYLTQPLTTYLAGIRGWPVDTRLSPRSGIDYFLGVGSGTNAAGISSDIWPQSKHSRKFECQWMSGAKLLVWKWGLRKLDEPQFFDTIHQLVERDLSSESTIGYVWQFMEDCSEESKPAFSPSLQPGHPNNVPKWWETVRLILDGLESTHRESTGWLRPRIQFRPETERLVAENLDHQSIKDAVLHDVAITYGRAPEQYGILSRTVIDKLLQDGANINGISGGYGGTVLYRYCNRLNSAYVGGDEQDYFSRSPFIWLMQAKITEFVISLVNKGADPSFTVGGLTSLDVLVKDIESIGKLKKRFLNDLKQAIREEREKFLAVGTTANNRVRRAKFCSYHSGLRELSLEDLHHRHSQHPDTGSWGYWVY